ncbi:MerR family transcriptional regulator [Streptomyces sp. NBC_00338]|uniref:MerR family transcriptional regulator n=1 Tax=Streptomyces sp. NBC_00338 TaxID=2975715 RepID=UPI002256F917|nr:MerR family transcriptional regulator [Streptomyces sp. NBC_00338]MCX5144580.1 MerR family transcriptional regulator [Streptomyces sp. NBC_00338]
MNGDTHLSIGELARRTGLTVRTVRSYSDRGIVPPAGRNAAGYRRYGPEAVARLNLVRTLRSLGIGLSTIRGALDRDTPLTDLAAAHAEALAVQIRVLSARRAVLMAAARRESTPEEMDRMHRLARLSEDERQALIREFLDEVFSDAGAVTHLSGVARSMTPQLPDDPSEEETEAWIELAELSQDADFRACIRRTTGHHMADRTEVARRAGRAAGLPVRDAEAVIHGHAAPARAAGVDPGSAQAGPVVDAVTAAYAQLCGRPDDAALRRRLAARLDTVNDPRRERYLRLLAVINRWPAPEPLSPELDWFRMALRTRTAA